MTNAKETGETAKGFASDWLSLREPVDHLSRNRAVEDAFFAHMETCEGDIRILDLGCGTGSTVRALAPRIAAHLPGRRQHWDLVDADAALLEEARRRAGEVASDDVSIAFRQADLADVGAFRSLIDEAGPAVISGSALIDLLSAEWLDRLAETAAEREIGLYFALNYSGAEAWLPPHPLDAMVLERFNRHQRGDKGFGPALGGAATRHLADALLAKNFDVTLGESDWRLDGGHHALIGMLAGGIAGAVGGAGGVEPDKLQDWQAARQASERVTIGHTDIFAAPPSS